MDVDRLMRDLTIEQLKEIQQSLEKEMEGKRESLREMVGRRYRDVLEASSEVRHVCELSEKLTNDIADTRISYQSSIIRTGSRDEQKIGEQFYAINYLMANIGGENGEPLDDAVGLLMAEHLLKKLISSHSSIMIHKVSSMAFTERIIELRKELEEFAVETLEDIDRCDWAVNQLAAIAILKGFDVEQLMDLYLERRLNYIDKKIESCGTILSVVEEIKKTLSVIENVFVHAQLQHAIQAIFNGQYRCELLASMCADQAFLFERTINDELERVWRNIRDKNGGRGVQLTLATSAIADKCDKWIESSCSKTHILVADVCEYFETIDQIVDLVRAITNSLRSNWPSIGSSRNVYETLLQDVVVVKAKKLINALIDDVETRFDQKFASMKDVPSTSLFDDRTYRNDSQLHIALSTQLYKHIGEMWDSLSSINDKCQQFEQICTQMQDVNTASALKSELANGVHEMLVRMCTNEVQMEGGDDILAMLNRARLAMGLLHSESGLVCHLLDKDSSRIAQLNRKLHEIVEEQLGNYSTRIADDIIGNSIELQRDYLSSLDSQLDSLLICQKMEMVEIADVGNVCIPVMPSGVIQSVLLQIAATLAEAAIGHLLSKTMRKKLAARISKSFAAVMMAKLEATSEWTMGTRMMVQMVFDAQWLNAMFASDEMKRVCERIEEHMDPFDVSIMMPLILNNVKMAYIRSQLMFAGLIVESLPSKDVQPAATYTEVQDVRPLLDTQKSRIPSVPRIDRATLDSMLMKKTKSTSGKIRTNKLLANPKGQTAAAPSLGSLYDKISSSWFGAN